MNDWIKAERHAENAYRLYEAGQWEKSMSEMKLALRVNPQQSDWHFGLGLALDAMQRYEEAAVSFECALQLRGDDAQTMVHLAIDLIRSRGFRRGIEVLQRVTDLDPNCEPAYCFRVLAHAELGEHELAEQMFYLARQVLDECPLCYDHVARSLAARGHLKRAIWCWQQALRMDAGHPEVRLNLAQAHWRNGQLEQARRCYLQHLRRDAEDRGALLQFGRLLIEMGRRAEAAETFRRAVESDPEAADAHLHLGELALISGHSDAANDALRTAARLDPQLPAVHLRLAQVAQRRGDRALARHLLELEVRRSGHHRFQMLELAGMLIEQGMPARIESLLSPLIDAADHPQAEQQVATAVLYRGVSRMLMGRHEEGIVDCRRAVRLAPRNTVAMENLAMAYLAQRRFARARCWLQRAIELRGSDPQLRLLHRNLRRAVWLDTLSRPLRRWIRHRGRRPHTQ